MSRRGSKGAAGNPGGLLRGREIGSVGRGKVGLEGRHPGKAHGAQRAGVLAAAAHRLHGGRQVVQVSAVHVNFQLHSVPAGEGAERTGQLKVRGSAAPQAKLGVKFQIIFHLEIRKKSVCLLAIEITNSDRIMERTKLEIVLTACLEGREVLLLVLLTGGVELLVVLKGGVELLVVLWGGVELLVVLKGGVELQPPVGLRRASIRLVRSARGLPPGGLPARC